MAATTGTTADKGKGSMAGLHELSQAQIAQFQRDGFLLVPRFFALEEIGPLARAFDEDPTAGGNAFTYDDGSASNHWYLGWVDPRDDLIGTFTTIERVVNGASALLGQPVYHFHSKIVIKPAHNRSVIKWHHDYSGWYADGCIAPDMLTCLVAVSPATRDNGCLKVLRGSQRVGRMDKESGSPTSTDPSARALQDQAYYSLNPRRLEALFKRFEKVEVEMAPGDALYFHASTVHSSGENSTDKPRIFLEMSYNATWNEPVLEGQEHHRCRPLLKVRNSAIKDHAYTTVFGRTPCLNVTDPNGAGTRIFLGNRANR